MKRTWGLANMPELCLGEVEDFKEHVYESRVMNTNIQPLLAFFTWITAIKSEVTELHHYAGLASIPYTGIKFLPHRG